MICPSCSTENRSGIAFCEECGSTLTVEAPCGHVNRAGIAFCEECGASLDAAPAVAACGHENRPGVQFCEECGEPIPVPVPTPPRVVARTLRPARADSLRRYGVAAMALLVLAASIGTGAWYLGRESVSTSPAVARERQHFSGPPAISPTEAMLAVGGFLGSSGVIDPYKGLAVEDQDGTIYIYDGGSRWTAITPDGSIWAIPELSAQLIEEDDRIIIAGDQSDIGWVEAILDDTPGVSKSGSDFVVGDYMLYRDGIIRAASEHGVILADIEAGHTRVIRPQYAEIGYVYAEADHAWIITRDGASLIIPEGNSMVIAGSIMAGPSGTLNVADFQPFPGGDTSQVRDILMNGKFGTYRTGPSNPSSPRTAGCLTLDEIYGAAPVDDQGVMVVDARVPSEACENQPEAQAASRRQAATQQDWAHFWAERRGGGSDGGCGAFGLSCAISQTGDLFEDGYQATVGRIDRGTICLIGHMTCPDKVWELIDDLWSEHDCGSIGPGSGRNGKGAPQYSADYDVAEIARQSGYTTQAVDFARDRLALARAWMPRMELSKDELCGEILRIVARVTAYAPDGKHVTSDLGEADRVEIVYTVFFRADGGRFGQEWHAGDNEGFVIALTRRDPSRGLCRGTDFEFLGGRAVAHKDASGWFQEVFHITEREIDDFWVGKSRASDDPPISNQCPSEGPEGGFFLHTAESKHATYYDRDKCERALAPDSAAVLVAFAFGFAVGGVAGPVGGAVGGVLTAVAMQKIVDSIPEDLKWQDGLEECEFDRTPYDLSHRIELFDDAFANKTTSFDQDYSGHGEYGGDHSFAAKVRGVVCPSSRWGFEVNNCLDDDFHVPGFFETAATPPPGEEILPTQVPTVDRGTFTESQARTSIKNAELEMRVVGTEPAAGSLVGKVVRQSPAGGSEALPGSSVRVWIGAAEEPTEVSAPDVLGQSISSARNEIEGLGLVYDYGELIPKTDPNLDGVAVDQHPPAGTPLQEGDTVRVDFGDYVPPLIAVPDLGGLPESTAISTIRSLGLVAQVVATIETTDSSFFGRVMDQDPMPYGADVAAGSTVRIWIGEQQAISYPAQETSPWVTIALQGSGHGTVHQVGETLTFCVSWAQRSGEPPPRWRFISYLTNPAGTYYTLQYMDPGGAFCPAESITLTGSTGLKQFEVRVSEYSYSQDQWLAKDTADLWIYVTN